MAKAKNVALRILDEKELQKKYGALFINAAEAYEEMKETLRIPSRCLWLNDLIGGGFVYGTINETYGYESTGKSLLAFDIAAATHVLGGWVLWGDAEQIWNHKWAKKNGLDLSRTIIYDSNDVEGMSDWLKDTAVYLRAKLTKNEPIFAVIDSIASLECEESIEGDQKDGKAEMGGRAKAIYKFYRKRVRLFKRYGVTVMALNQVRDKVGASLYELATTTPGGAATKFFSSIRLELGPGKTIKGSKKAGYVAGARDGKRVGKVIYCRNIKNKTAPPKNPVQTEVHFTEDKFGYVGWARYSNLAEILTTQKVIKKQGNAYYFKGVRIAKSKDGLEDVLLHDDKLRRKLIGKSNINTISKTQEKLDSIDKNLYPVKLKAGKTKNKSDEE